MSTSTYETKFTHTTSVELREFVFQCVNDREIALHIEELEIEEWIPDILEDAHVDFDPSDHRWEAITTAIKSAALYPSDTYSDQHLNWLEQVSGGNDEPLICLLLILCENAVKLSIRPPYGSDFLRVAFNHPRRPPHIREVSVEHYDTENGFYLEEVEPILLLPSLQKMTWLLASEEAPSEYSPTNPSVRSTLKHLDILYSSIDPEALVKFLALCPDLEVLGYEENCITEPAAFTQALQSSPSVCDNLKELRLSGFLDSIFHIKTGGSHSDRPVRIHSNGSKISSTVPLGDDGIYTFPAHRCFGSFEALSTLEVLQVQFPQMLKHGPNKILTKDAVVGLLPKQVVHVKFIDLVVKEDKGDHRHEDRLVEIVKFAKPELSRWETLIVDVALDQVPKLTKVCQEHGLRLTNQVRGPLNP